MAVQVKVHDNVAALRRVAKQYDKGRDKPEQDHSDILGICHRRHMAGELVVALIRLAPPHVGAGIVAHELLHAAVWIWEIQHMFSRKVPITCNNDEWFCWVHGELVRQTHAKLWEHGVYR